MGIIKDGTVKIGGKIVRVKVFGYESEGKFVATQTYINNTDLVNIGILSEELNWNDDNCVGDEQC